MKACKGLSLFTSGLFLLVAFDLFAQSGIVNFSNTGVTDDRKIYYELPRTGGQTRGDIAPCSGNEFRIALYWGPPGTTDDRNLVQIGASTGFLTGSAAGTFFGGGRTITYPGPTPGPVLSFQARGWEAAFGTSWEAVASSGNPQARFGKGPVFELKTKDPLDVLPEPNIGNAPGWRGFVIGYGGGWIIPEPSTTALCVVGVASLLFLRRRR